MNSDSGDVTIGKFFLCGDLTHRQQLLDGLDQLHWQASHTQRVFIIRRVKVSAPWWLVCQQVAECVGALVREAVPADDADSEHAKAVYFASLAHFYAHFCCYLTNRQNRRYQAWYWQGYAEASMNPEQAIARILTENIFHVPKILAILEKQKRLDEVFLPLSVKSLEEVLVAIGLRTGWSAVLSKPQLLALDAVATCAPSLTPECDAVLNLWRPLLKKVSTKKKNVLLRFISTILAWRYVPKVLSKKESLSLWQIAIEKRILTENYHQIDVQGNATFNNTLSEKVDQAKGERPQQTRQTTAAHSVSDSLSSQDVILQSMGDNSECVIEKGNKENSEKGCETNIEKDHHDNRISHKYVREHFLKQGFLSQCAGIFFLLNAIEQLKLFSICSPNPPSIWHVLYRLSVRLRVELDEPMRELFALQNSVELAAKLDILPALEAENDIVAVAEKRYSQHEFWPCDLIVMPGNVYFNESHLDVYFHMRDLRLDIRLAGLDINPGWLPWLGRIVNFHYGQDSTVFNPTTHSGDLS